MNKNIIFATGEGIGNIISCLPTLLTLKNILNFKITFWFVFGSYSIPRTLFSCVDKFIIGNEIKLINTNDYLGIVSTYWAQNYVKYISLPLLNDISHFSMKRSEVDTYMDIARGLGVKESNIEWCGECNYNKRKEYFDVVISDGYNKKGSAMWKIKSYPYYKEVVALLKKDGYSVASIGDLTEYVQGSVNMTRMSFLDSGGIIKNSRLLLSNDSGMYHYSNTLSTKSIVIFSATSIEKNYDKRFHKHSDLLYRSDLKCRPCQKNHGWKKCKTWECREIDPQLVVNTIKEKLN